MNRTLVDTSALIALLYPDDAHNEFAATLLHEAAEDGAVLIDPVVYVELAADRTSNRPRRSTRSSTTRASSSNGSRARRCSRPAKRS